VIAFPSHVAQKMLSRQNDERRAREKEEVAGFLRKKRTRDLKKEEKGEKGRARLLSMQKRGPTVHNRERPPVHHACSRPKKRKRRKHRKKGEATKEKKGGIGIGQKRKGGG